MLISNKTTTSSSSTTYKNSSPPSHSGPHNYRAERTSAHMLLLKDDRQFDKAKNLSLTHFSFFVSVPNYGSLCKMYLNTIQVVRFVPVIYLTENIISKQFPTVHFHRIISFLSLFPSSKKSDKAALLPRLSLLHPNKIRIFLPPKK